MKLKSINRVKLDTPIPVYDLEVQRNSNFCLSNGIVIHNSKDIADAVAGSLYQAYMNKDIYMSIALSKDYINELKRQTGAMGAYDKIARAGRVSDQQPI